MFREKDEADLRNEILVLKRQLNGAKNENTLLKVKIRKLQEEIVKKNKHIEVLLHPKKSSAFHKVMSENGATIVMNSLERNLKLQKLLDEKNAQIKKLQLELETVRLYSAKEKRKPSNVIKADEIKVKILQEQKSSSLTASLEGHCAYNVKSDEAPCPRNSGSPESDLDRNELFCETPHKEIQQLHKYVIDVLSEVDVLKETIAQMQGDHRKTESLLEKKEDELLKLQREMRSFRNSQLKAKCLLDGKRRCLSGNKTEASTKKTMKINKSPRKFKKADQLNVDKSKNVLTSCMDAIETQIQRESSSITTESDGGDDISLKFKTTFV